MNRREFLRTGTAAAAASTISAKSYARILGANDRVGLGIIGLGRRATVVTGLGFRRDPRANIVALCDVYDAQTPRFVTRLLANQPTPFSSYRYQDVLDRKDVDAVYIATPDHLHVMIATAALGAGKNVYLEKPTLHHWSERTALIAAAHKSSKVLQCGMQQRSGAHYMQAKQELFDQKKLGHVVFARGTWDNFPWQTRNIGPKPEPPGMHWELFEGPAPHVPWAWIRYTSWRYFPDYGNGLLADIMTHWVDVAQWMQSDANPRTASALGGIYQLHDGRVNPDTVSAIVQYSDWNFNFESTVLPVRDPHPAVLFEGTEGTLMLARDGYTYTPNEGEPVRVNARESLEQAHTRNFLDAVVEGKKANASLQAGIDASIPVQMALQSYWSHKMVTRPELT